MQRPVTMRTAKLDNRLIGIGSVNNVDNDTISCTMEITEKIIFDEYYNDNRFQNRIDNIYHIH